MNAGMPHRDGSGAGRRVVMVFGKSFDAYQGRYLRAYNQARTLVEAGYAVTVLAWDRDGDRPPKEERDGINIRRIQIKAGTNVGPYRNARAMLRFNWTVWKLLCEEDPLVVHAFDLEAPVATLCAARWLNRRAVLDISEPDYYRGFWRRNSSWLLLAVDVFERIVARRFDHVFLNTTYQQEKFRDAGLKATTMLGCYPRRQMVLSSLPEKEQRRFTIGFLGTMYKGKGIEQLVTAFGQLLERHRNAGHGIEFRLVLAGHVHESFRPTLDKLIEPFKERVELTGAYDIFKDLPELYKKIDVSVLLYNRDTFANITPTKLYESLANGVPVICNDVGDMGAVVQEGGFGVVVDEESPEAIYRSIDKLALDTEERRKMAQRCLHGAQERYCWEAIRQRYLEAYEGLARKQ